MRATASFSAFGRPLLRILASGAVTTALAVGATGCASAQDIEEDTESSESALTPPKAILAIGDSITFGWDPNLQPDIHQVELEDYSGYAEVLGSDLGFDVHNAACPGEATGSFLSATATDFGCRELRSAFGTHYAWNSHGAANTQMTFVEKYLRANDPELITLTIGANDLLVLQQKTCGGNYLCITWNLLGTINKVGHNLTTMFQKIAATGYQGRIAVITQYSPDYSDFVNHVALGGLAAKVKDFVKDEKRRHPQLGVFVADAYEGFRAKADAGHGGKTCKTGLLLKNPDGVTCDAHPSEEGDKLIAKIVRDAWEAQ